MPTRVVWDDDEQIIADLLRASRRHRAVAGSQMPKPAKDSFTVAATPATDYPLTAIPLTSDLGSSLVLSLNGLVLVEDTDYTVDYDTAIVTVSETLVEDDVLYAEYWTTGELVARTLPAEDPDHLVEFVGTGLGAGWAMSDATVGKRISGVWTYATIAAGDFLDEGVVDAYSVETTVTAVPVGSIHADWRACASNYAALTGIVLDSDNTGTTLYLLQAGTPDLSTAAAATPTVGDTVIVVTDFTTEIATVTLNGSTIHTLDFSSATWFSAGMTAP